MGVATDGYDEAVLQDKPHAYWRMSAVADGVSPIGRRRWIVSDFSGLPPEARRKSGDLGEEGLETAGHGRFPGWTDDDTEGCPRKTRCSALVNTTAKGGTDDGFAALNAMGGK